MNANAVTTERHIFYQLSKKANTPTV